MIAVEPHPESFRHLQKTVEENKLSQVTPINVAAGDSQREVSLFVTDANKADSRIYNDSGNRQKLMTKMIDLDRLLAENATVRVPLIKMDIQGAEGLALQGMTRTLANNPGLVIFAEFWPWGLAQTGVSPSVFLRDLLQAGFRFQAIDEDKRRH